MPLDAGATSLSVIREEHAWIARMLECLERLMEDARPRGRLEAEGAAELLALFAHFADGVHQQREESYLFPRLLARAQSVEQRLAIGKLCGDHEEERRALRSLNESLLGAIYGQAGDLAAFLRGAEQYVRLHRRHLWVENQELLPLAERLLWPEDDERLCVLYQHLERAQPDRAGVAARVRGLCARLGIEPSTAP